MSGAARKLTRRVEQVMGMPISLAVSGRHATSPKGEAAWAEALASLRDADAVFSTYREDSWVSRLGRGEVAVEDCPAEVGEVLALAETARTSSAGAFDVRLPRLDGTTAFDPSGIVKGWAVDRAATYLRCLEETDFCLSAGGDMVCSTSSPQTPAWRVGIEDPREPSRLLAVVPLHDAAIATSGLAHRGAHIVDPRTGATPETWSSVTVVAEDLTAADTDATAAFVMGYNAPGWLDARGRTGLLVRPNGSTLTVGAWAAAS
ncbi:MAG: FAD:protein FMN transferase [Marmoricola sp.]